MYEQMFAHRSDGKWPFSRPNVTRVCLFGAATRRRCLIDQQAHLPYFDSVAGPQLTAPDGNAVAPRPVRGAEVLEDPAAVAEAQLCVAPRDRRIGEPHVAAVMPASRQ